MENKDADQQQKRSFPLTQIYFYLTRGCNLRCRHCWIAPKFQDEGDVHPSLDFDVFCSIIEQAKEMGLQTVKLTGGEPLIHPNIREIIDVIRKEDLRLTIETNGVCCTAELVQQIKTCKNPFVSVSLDGADAETHEWVRGVDGCFEDALQGIRNLVSAGFRPQVIMSVMRRNKDQMRSVVELAESLGAGSVKFNIVQPTARGERLHERQETLGIAELVELGVWVERELIPSTNLKVLHSHPAAFRPFSRMFGDNGDGAGVCGIFGIMGVLGDGSYALCGIGESVDELIFGQAATDRLKDVWENNPVLNQIREGLPKRLQGICADCLLRLFCLGSCIAQNYYRSKDLWAPFWYCEQAQEMGLFPENRLDYRRLQELKGK